MVYIYGSEDISGMPAIAMELLPGATLKERVENEGPLAPIEAVDAILQVVSGLEAAHDAGVLHRDIKPSNCFVDADGTVKVGDFGLAIPALEHLQLTAMGTIQATPQFASPEQLGGKPLDVRSDIYAVGATLYYLLTGRPPFDDRDCDDARLAHRDRGADLPARGAAGGSEAAGGGRPAVSRDESGSSAGELSRAREDARPLGSTAKTPAPPGIRFAAYAFDTFLSVLLLNIVLGTVLLLDRPSSVFGAKPVVATLLAVSYFAITEGVWGASLGKALCGFRVVTESGAPPRFGRTLLRALVFFLPPWLASGMVLSIAGLVYSMQGRSAHPDHRGSARRRVADVCDGAPVEWICRHARMGDPHTNGVEVRCWDARARPVSSQADRGSCGSTMGWTVPDRGYPQFTAEWRRRRGIRRSASAHRVAAVPRSACRSGSACETHPAEIHTAPLVGRAARQRAGVGCVRTGPWSTIGDVGDTGAVVGDGSRMAL